MKSVYEREVSAPIDVIEERLIQAVERRNYGVLGSIDLREKMNSKGVEFDRYCRIYEVCNPLRAKRVLEAQMAVSTALPCRISVYEEAGTIRVATMLPSAILAGLGSASLEDEAREVEEDLMAIIDDVTLAE